MVQTANINPKMQTNINHLILMHAHNLQLCAWQLMFRKSTSGQQSTLYLQIIYLKTKYTHNLEVTANRIHQIHSNGIIETHDTTHKISSSNSIAIALLNSYDAKHKSRRV